MDLKSIHEIFTNRIFRIPSYQRGYSWANKKVVSPLEPEKTNQVQGQLMDLWNDIISTPQGSWHYTGLLTLVEMTNHDYKWLQNHRQYAVVDGQQRITSILILIAVLVEEAKILDMKLGIRDGDTEFQYLYIHNSDMYAYIFGYYHDNPSDKYFRKHILNLDIIEGDSHESFYTENLRNAKEFFKRVVREHIKKDNDKEGSLKLLFNRVTTDLRLNEYILPSELDQYVVFETMNNRGKPLSELEKLKNRLMYLADKYATHKYKNESKSIAPNLKTALEAEINTGWNTIYQALGGIKDEPLDDEDFIKNHWIAYFDEYNRSVANAYANFLFNEHFTLQRIYDGSLSIDDIRNYVKSLQKSAKVWSKMHFAELFETNETRYKDIILRLHRVGFRTAFKPIVLAVLLNNNPDEYLEILDLLEQYAFKIFHVSDRQSNTGDSRLYRLAYKILNSTITCEPALKEIRNHINSYYRFSLFENQIEDLFSTGNMKGYYEWSGIRYFLYQYDWQLRDINNAITRATELIWEDFQNKNSIEHIYPQSAAMSEKRYLDKDDSPGKRAGYDKIQKDWSTFSHYTPEERWRLANSLGNLLAISKKDNSSYSNDPFKYKVDQSEKGDGYRNRGYRFDSMSAQIVAKENDWTPETVLLRGLDMIDKMLILLDESVDSITKEDKVKLLGLDFMVTQTIQRDVNDRPVV